MRSASGIIALVLRGQSAFLCPDIYAEYEKLQTIGHMGHVREYTPRDVISLAQHVGLAHRRTIYRAGARQSWAERLVTAACPPLRPYATFVFQRND